mgnify:FL=1|tara:strand:- start:22756 stop:23694 length:939 start_codon:yes stop_codon:yes gene_type:complete
MIDIKNKKVIVTGAASMVGRSIIKELETRGAIVDRVLHEECDLLDFNQCLNKFKESKPDYCIHAAGYNGNISFNRQYPSDIFYNTTIMGLNTLKACSLVGVKKVVSLLSSCAYRSTDEELREEDFFKGMPDSSVDAHGLSKKSLFYYSKQISKQYDITAVCTIFNTAYGPFDSFKIEKTKVCGALIKKFTDAVINSEDQVVCWGTGAPRRELIYCDDAGKGVVETLQKYDDESLPINIGFNEDISIEQLANKIAAIVGFKNKIVWDTNKPDGQYRKILNADRMNKYNIKIKDSVSLDEGLKKTIQWYKEMLK